MLLQLWGISRLVQLLLLVGGDGAVPRWVSDARQHIALGHLHQTRRQLSTPMLCNLGKRTVV